MTEENNKAATMTDVLGSNPVALVVPRWSWKVWLIWCFSFSVPAVFGILTGGFPRNDPTSIPFALLVGPLGATFYYGIYFLIKRAIYQGLFRRGQALAITQKAEVLQEDLEKDFFTDLVKINFKYLDKYYLQTQEQGDKSFLLCLFAALIGLSIITAGIVMMFLNKTKPAATFTYTAVKSRGEFMMRHLKNMLV